jgi:alkaline phosphatase
MRKRVSVLVFTVAALVSSCSSADSPTRVILFIGDGAGVAFWTAASLASDDLAFKQLPVVGLVETQSADSTITDSGAAATAFASGIRTLNNAVGVDADSNVVPTVLEIAQQRGMATGLVVTSTITHATPAAFAAHVPYRYMDFEIARQLADADIDVLLGGGSRYFDAATRADSSDGVDLLAAMDAEYEVLLTPEDFQNVDTDSVSKILGLFASRHMPDAFSRSPTLPEMTTKAIEVLDKDPDGFFLMVEGSQPDWRGEDNSTLDSVVAEMLDLDRAIQVALDYQSTHPSTLLVVVADHEAGGLALQHANPDEPDYVDVPPGDPAGRWPLVARYTTGAHTATMVPLFASGPGAEVFGGIKENWEIGQLLMEAVQRRP